MSPRRSSRKKKRKVGPRAIVPEDEDAGENEIVASGPLKLLSDLRQQAQNNLHGQAEQTKDLEYLIGTVRGLIATNIEIWERCKHHVTCNRADGSAYYGVPGRVQIGSDVKFTEQVDMVKLSYHKVHVEKNEMCESVNINTTKLPEYKTFALPPSIPASLTNTVPQASCQKDDQPFPDYDAYFMAAVLLQNEVLASFLQALQPHLENVQVWLGGIESWLLESQSIVDFLNDLFEKDLKVNDFTETTWHEIQDKEYDSEILFHGISIYHNKTGEEQIVMLEAHFDLRDEADKTKLEAFYRFAKLYQ